MPVGLLAAAILVVNNVRDIDTDRRAGKRTLAVRLGRDRARVLFAAMLIARLRSRPRRSGRCGGLSAWLLLPLAALPLAPPLVRTVATRTDGPALNGALAGTGRLLAVFSLLLSAGVCSREALAAPPVDPAPRAVRDGRRRGRRRASWCCCASRTTTARSATARPRRFEPYDGVTVERSIAALTRRRRGGAAPGARRARRWRGSTSRPAARAAPLGEPGARRDPGEQDPAGRAARGGRRARTRGRAARATRASRSRSACPTTTSAWPRCARRSARGRRCGWTPTAPGRVDEAVRAIAALEPYDLELVEQPCRTLEELRQVRRASVEVPIAADESIGRRDDVRAAAEPGLRRGERQARRARRLHARARGLRAARARTASRPSSRARSTGPGASPPRSSWRPPSGSRWPAGWRRSSCSTPAWRARCPAPATGSLARAAGPGPGRRASTTDVARRGARRGSPRVARRPRRALQLRRVAGVSTIASWPPLGGSRPCARRGRRSARRARRRAPAAAARAGQLGPRPASTPWPAVRSSAARSRGSWPGARRAAPRPAPRTGRRTAAGAPTAPRSPRSRGAPSTRRAARRPRRVRARRGRPRCRPSRPTVTRPRSAPGSRSAACSASRPPSE